MMLKCKEVTRLVSQGLDRQLGLGEQLRLRAHLAICDACSHFSRQMRFLRKAIARLGDPDKS
jgi:hypothetical protein